MTTKEKENELWNNLSEFESRIILIVEDVHVF